MEINKNDKFIATKKLWYIEEDTVVTVTDVGENGIVLFTFGEDNNNGNGYMDINTFERHFERHFARVEENENEVVFDEYEHVAYLLNNSEFETCTVFGKTVIMSCKLPNGYVVTETHAFSNAEEYDEEFGEEICYDKIFDRVLELERYKRQEMDSKSVECNCTCDGCCSECDM